MPIINSDNFPIIDTSLDFQNQLKYGSENDLWNLKDWSKYDYWFCEIKFGDAFKKVPLETVMTQRVLEKIKNDKTTFLVVSNTHEAFHHIIEPLYQSLIIKYEIPPKKIILMSESADVCNVVIDVAKQYQLDTIQVEWTLIFERQIKREADQIPKKLFKDYNKQNYKKRFLNLNRRWRLHRVSLVAFLKCFNLLDFGYVSLGRSDDRRTWPQVYNWFLNYHISDKELYDLILSKKDDILNTPDLYLDTEDLVTNRAEIGNSLNEFYKESFFSVVTETNFYSTSGWESGRFFSEKIFKPIAYKHPFILLSVPNSLKLLKELGYKTFDGWIDESYDAETNDILRMKKILKEIERICNFTDTEITDFVKETRPIVEFNFRKLITRNVQIYKKL